MPGDEEQPHQALRAQLQGTFAATYLTMLSIIQGVALADLTNVIAGHYTHFTIVHWIMAGTAFCIIAEIWTHFMTDATSKGWIPGYGDSVLFFGLGAGELFLNHAIELGLTAWLFGMTGAAVAGLGTLVFIRRREERDVSDPVLLSILRQREWVHRWHGVVGMVVFSLGFVVCLRAGIGAETIYGGKGVLSIGFAGLSAGWIGALVVITALHWRSVIEYVHTGELRESVIRRRARS